MAYDPNDPNNGSYPTDAPQYGNVTVLNEGEGEPGFARSGPILSVERLKDEYLFGIPLASPLTGQVLSDVSFKNIIRKAIGDFETSVRIPISPVTITDKFNFERADDLAFGTRQTTRWPIIKVIKFAALYPGRFDGSATHDATLGSSEVLYPTSWVNFQGDCGVWTITPTNATLEDPLSYIAAESYRAITLGAAKHWPNMWRLTYRAGFEFDKIPDIVNDLIGILAALRVLSMISPAAFPINSFSVGIDGMSQSTGNAGPQWLAGRVQDLISDRDRITQQLKAHYGTDQIFLVM